MAAITRRVHVHGAEVSTDRGATLAYAETIAVLLAVVAVLAAAWVAASPREAADLAVPAPDANAPVRQLQAQDLADPRVTNVVQPVPSGPSSTELGGATRTVDPTRPEAVDG